MRKKEKYAWLEGILKKIGSCLVGYLMQGKTLVALGLVSMLFFQPFTPYLLETTLSQKNRPHMNDSSIEISKTSLQQRKRKDWNDDKIFSTQVKQDPSRKLQKDPSLLLHNHTQHKTVEHPTICPQSKQEIVQSSGSPPSVEITEPDNKSQVSGEYVSVYVEVNDPDYDVNNTELYINGTLVASRNYSGISYNWNTTQYDNGNYTLLAKAYDEAGNTDTTYIFVTVDNHPSVEIWSPTNGTFHNEEVRIYWYARRSSSNTFIHHFELKRDSTPWKTIGGADKDEYVVSNLTHGEHTIRLKAVDERGHIGTDFVNFSVDAIAPTTTILNPKKGENMTSSNITVRWNGSDATTNVSGYRLRVDGIFAWGVIPRNKTEHVISGLADGKHKITLQVFDSVWNIQNKSIIFTVDARTAEVKEGKDTGGLSMVVVGALIGIGIGVISVSAFLYTQKYKG